MTFAPSVGRSVKLPLPYENLYAISHEPIVRIDCCAEPSLAARLLANKFGIAIEAIIPIMVTTMRSSMSEKPARFWCCTFIFCISALLSLFPHVEDKIHLE